MKFRLTVTIGRDTLDRQELLRQGQLLDEWFAHGPVDPEEPAGRLAPDIFVDPVKATLQIVCTIDASSALDVPRICIVRFANAFDALKLPHPTSIVTVETEHVPDPAGSDILVMHVDEE